MDLRNIFRRNVEQPKIEKRAVNIDGSSDDCGCSGFALSYLPQYQNYSSMNLSAVFAAVEMISNSIASVPIHIRTKSGEIIDNHYIYDVFEDNLQSKFILMKQLIVDLLIHGNAICYIKKENGIPSGLIYCPKSTYSINYNIETRKLTYSIPSISSRELQPKEVIHLLKNTNDGAVGKGFLYYAQRTLGIASAAENQAKGYFDSGCGINGILKSSKHLSKKQQKDIESAWNQAHAGGNGSNLAVLPVDLDYIQLAANASESQLLETRLFSVQEIARFFNISPVLLGELSHSSYNTLENAQQEFLIHTLHPYINILQDEFNRKLVPEKDVYIDFAQDHLLIADKSTTASYLTNLVKNGIMSINEARHDLDLPEKEGADELFIPYTDLSQNKVNGDNSKDEKDDVEDINK